MADTTDVTDDNQGTAEETYEVNEEGVVYSSESAPGADAPPRPATIAPAAATGRRKEAVARVRLVPGTGEWTVNGTGIGGPREVVLRALGWSHYWRSGGPMPLALTRRTWSHAVGGRQSYSASAYGGLMERTIGAATRPPVGAYVISFSVSAERWSISRQRTW